MSSHDDDQLLSVLDQLTNHLYWYQDRVELTAAAAIAEAADDWVAEHAAEHHHSQPFLAATDDLEDSLSVALAHLRAATVTLIASGARPEISFTDALTEALGEWVAATAAEHHQSEVATRTS